MKKWMTLALVLALSMGMLAGCGNKDAASDTNNGANQGAPNTTGGTSENTGTTGDDTTNNGGDGNVMTPGNDTVGNAADDMVGSDGVLGDDTANLPEGEVNGSGGNTVTENATTPGNVK